MSAPTTDRGGIQQTIRALRDAGYKLHHVWDGEEEVDVDTESAAVDAVTGVDDALLYVDKDGDLSWVRFVLGNDPEEVICDYTVDLAGVLEPLTDRWFSE